MGLLAEHGTIDGEQKIANYRAIGATPFSVVFTHNVFLRQIRSSFAHGDFYPALVSACALGERILIELILALRDDYLAQGAKVFGRFKKPVPKSSDWNSAIEQLHRWGVLSDELRDVYSDLERQRHASVHFDSKVPAGEREPALCALLDVQRIVVGLFAADDPQWFIGDAPGGIFLRRAAEEVPLIKRIYLPCAALVSPSHSLDAPSSAEATWRVFDDAGYDSTPLTDEQFAEALQTARPVPAPESGEA